MCNRETGADLDDLALQILVVKSAPNQALQPTPSSVRFQARLSASVCYDFRCQELGTSFFR